MYIFNFYKNPPFCSFILYAFNLLVRKLIIFVQLCDASFQETKISDAGALLFFLIL
uniref:Uncharacterized protein n=1 Tax=Parascaris univalens TaxID=6257 RepID=A0A915AQK9_PARUN